MPTATIGNSADSKRASLRGWFACAFVSVLIVFAYAFVLATPEAQAKSAHPNGNGNGNGHGAKGDGNRAKGGDLTKTADPNEADLKSGDNKGGGSADKSPLGIKDTLNSAPNTSPNPGVAPSGHEATPANDPVGGATPTDTGATTPTPTPDPVGVTPTPDPVGVTPTPDSVEVTPTPDPVGVTPTPDSVEVTPTPDPVGVTPTPAPVEVTPTPDPVGVTPIPDPIGVTPTPTPAPVGVMSTPDPIGVMPTLDPVGVSITNGQFTPELTIPSDSNTESVSESILTPSSVEFLPRSTSSEFASESVVPTQVTKPANEGPLASPIATQLKATFGSLATTIMHSVDRLLSPNSGLLTNLLTHTNDQTSGLLEWLSGVLGGVLEGGNAPSSPVDTPFTPTPVAPAPPAPAAASFTSNFLNGAKHTDQDYLMLFGVLALFSIPLIEGMFSLHRSELLKPSSLPHLAIERPG